MLERKKIEDIVRERLKETESFLVNVIVSRSNVIQVFIDHANGVSLDDCARVHRGIEEQLDREEEDYELQVSSPGLGQPMHVFPQYIKAVGQKLEVQLQDGDVIKGILLSAKPVEKPEDSEIVIRQSGTKRKPALEEPLVIQLNRIKTARVEIDFKQV